MTDSKKKKRKVVGINQRVKYIHQVTGIKRDTIKEVLHASNLLDINSIAEGKQIYIDSAYSLKPKFRKAYRVYSPATDKIVTVPAQYILKVKTHSKMQEALDILLDSKEDSE